jgi:hypothetical protein
MSHLDGYRLWQLLVGSLRPEGTKSPEQDQTARLPANAVPVFHRGTDVPLIVEPDPATQSVINQLAEAGGQAGVQFTKWVRLLPMTAYLDDGEAVAVLVEGRLVGRLSRHDAARYHQVLRGFAAAGHEAHALAVFTSRQGRRHRDGLSHHIKVLADAPEDMATQLADI